MRGHALHVDCADCAARGPACSDCVISVLLGAPPQGVDLDTEEQAALSALAESGLVPPLRLVPRYAASTGYDDRMPAVRPDRPAAGEGGW